MCIRDSNEIVRVGGVRYTIKDGIIYDARKLLEDVKSMVDETKEAEGFKINQPGMDAYFEKIERP